MFTAILTAVLFGGIVGAPGRLVLPGRQSISVRATIGIGIAAALLGTILAALLGVNHTDGVNWIQHILQIALAAAGVTLWTRREVAR